MAMPDTSNSYEPTWDGNTLTITGPGVSLYLENAGYVDEQRICEALADAYRAGIADMGDFMAREAARDGL